MNGMDLGPEGATGEPDRSMPKHAVFVDPARKTIVLAIRGTSSLQDALTDCQCAGAPFLLGMAHEKFAHFAKSIVDRSYSRIVDYATANGTEQVVVTGHSLGAGVASLAGMYLRFRQLRDQALPGQINIKCFPIATPSCFRRDPENSPAYGTEVYRNHNQRMVDADPDIATGEVADPASPDHALKIEAVEYMFQNTHNFVLENDCIPHVGLAAEVAMWHEYKQIGEIAEFAPKVVLGVKVPNPTLLAATASSLAKAASRKYDEEYVDKFRAVFGPDHLGPPDDPRRWGDDATVSQFQVGHLYHITHIPDPEVTSWLSKDARFQVMHSGQASLEDPRTAWLALGRPRGQWLYLSSGLLAMHGTVSYLQGLFTAASAPT